jgi:hypothetical protein
MEKLEIMIALASDRNIDQVLLEFREYATEVDVDFVRKARVPPPPRGARPRSAPCLPRRSIRARLSSQEGPVPCLRCCTQGLIGAYTMHSLVQDARRCARQGPRH